MFQIANIERHRTSVTTTRGLLDLKSTSKGMFIILKYQHFLQILSENLNYMDSKNERKHQHIIDCNVTSHLNFS